MTPDNPGTYRPIQSNTGGEYRPLQSVLSANSHGARAMYNTTGSNMNKIQL